MQFHSPHDRRETRVVATIVAVSTKAGHGVDKVNRPSVRLVAGEGVEGDAHRGVTVRHRSRVARDPAQPNLRQVHLLHAELLDELAAAGFDVAPGRMGENVTTRGVDLLDLPEGTRLRLGPDAVVELTGLRNPCDQLERLQEGLKGAVLDRDADGTLVRKAGVMGVVLCSGEVKPGDELAVDIPPGAAQPLRPV
jgi:MOSC domain-containing protein YiiM